MTASVNLEAIIVFAVLFGVVAIVGFMSGRWNRTNANPLSEWALGGRRFGTVITWFMLGGDVYTAYTFVAVPALMFGVGAMGFFSVLTMMLVYPILFAIFPRLWSVSHARGYMTAADFVRARFGNHVLALAVAVTGIVATMPYIALQLVGLEVVIAGLGVHFAIMIGRVSLELPLLIAFVILAAYTYTSGLRASAMISIVKNILVYGTVIAAIVAIPAELGGYSRIFSSIALSKLLLAPSTHGNLGSQASYASLGLGSALALFLYPHSITGILSSSSRDAIKRSAVIMPAYTFALGFIALLGFMATAAHVETMRPYANGFQAFGTNFAVPALFLDMFPGWFAGIAFAAIGIGALVPAAIMSIASGNLFTRNIYKEYIDFGCTPARECQVAKFAALAVMLGGLIFNVGFPRVYAVQMQLLGGIWIIQTLPAVILGLYTSRLHPWALLIGWVTGIAAGTAMAVSMGLQNSVYGIHIFGIVIPCYIAVSTLILNIAVSAVCSPLFSIIARTADATVTEDYI
jgi:SSS family solute:Na+ symporter